VAALLHGPGEDTHVTWAEEACGNTSVSKTKFFLDWEGHYCACLPVHPGFSSAVTLLSA